MITNPIIPIWQMSVICIIIAILVIYDRKFFKIISKKNNEIMTDRKKNLIKNYIQDTIIKLICVILLFVINLRFMIPNGETTAVSLNLDVLFVMDISMSMKALDYNGTNERLEGVINDCTYIVENLNGCRFSMITFSDTARKLVPFTTDSNLMLSEIESINIENSYYAQGTSMNVVKDLLENTLKEEQQKRGKETKIVVFFITDGEITKER